MQKTALVLSGGGGRGAYHVGVYRALVELGWVIDGQGPDIIVGTSIGAVNGAAIASGRTVAELEALWRAMRTEHVQTLSREVPVMLRPVLRYVFKDVLTSDTHELHVDVPGGPKRSTGPGGWIGGGLFSQMFPPFLHIFDTTPWRHTFTEAQATALGPLNWVDWQRINSPAAPALTITATDVSSGLLRTFSNRDLPRHAGAEKITIDHLMASSSIPLIYPWTHLNDRQYWDGAVLANTPLEPVIELAGDAEVDTIVVMMSPWYGSSDPRPTPALPDNLFQALARTLDWALAASYQTALELLEERNRLARAVAQLVAAGLPWDGPRPRVFRRPLIVAPEELMPPDWIIDYELDTHEHLFQLGYQDAQRAWRQRIAERGAEQPS